MVDSRVARGRQFQMVRFVLEKIADFQHGLLVRIEIRRQSVPASVRVIRQRTGQHRPFFLHLEGIDPAATGRPVIQMEEKGGWHGG